jgi:uncharacterized protein
VIEDVRGISIPFRMDPATGGVAQADGPEKIKENLIHLLLTGIGERAMRRDYGGGLQQLVHDPNNDALRAIVAHQVGKSISEAEPRVALQEVAVTQQDGTLVVSIYYVLRETRLPQSLSVPIGLGGI